MRRMLAESRGMIGSRGARRAVAAAVALTLMAAGQAWAAEAPPSPDESQEKQRRATDLAITATQMLMRALQLMIESLPQYGPPEIDEDGNIVIPRIHNEPEPEDKPAAPDKGTPGEESPGTPL